MTERIRLYRPKGAELWGFMESREDLSKPPRCAEGWEAAEFIRVAFVDAERKR